MGQTSGAQKPQPPKKALRYNVPVPKAHKVERAAKRRLTLLAIRSLLDFYKAMHPAAIWRGYGCSFASRCPRSKGWHCSDRSKTSQEQDTTHLQRCGAADLETTVAERPISFARSWLCSQGLSPINNPVRQDCWWTSHEALGGSPVVADKNRKHLGSLGSNSTALK